MMVVVVEIIGEGVDATVGNFRGLYTSATRVCRKCTDASATMNPDVMCISSFSMHKPVNFFAQNRSQIWNFH